MANASSCFAMRKGSDLFGKARPDRRLQTGDRRRNRGGRLLLSPSARHLSPLFYTVPQAFTPPPPYIAAPRVNRTLKPRCPLPPSTPFRYHHYPPSTRLVAHGPRPPPFSLRLRRVSPNHCAAVRLRRIGAAWGLGCLSNSQSLAEMSRRCRLK